MSQKPDMLTSGKFFQALKILLPKLEGEGVDFVLIGSFNLFVQGIEIEPEDIDLLADDAGIEKVSQVFGSQTNREEPEGYKQTEFVVDGIKVHAVSNKNNPLRPAGFQRQVVWLEKEGLKIPCLSLESELAFYQKVDRAKDHEKVQLIKAFLQEI